MWEFHRRRCQLHRICRVFVFCQYWMQRTYISFIQYSCTPTAMRLVHVSLYVLPQCGSQTLIVLWNCHTDTSIIPLPSRPPVATDRPNRIHVACCGRCKQYKKYTARISHWRGALIVIIVSRNWLHKPQSYCIFELNGFVSIIKPHLKSMFYCLVIIV